MVRILLTLILFLFLGLSGSARAQEEDVQTSVDYRLNKMQTSLHLTDTQVSAIRPILKDYVTKHQAVLQQESGEGIVDHTAVKTTLKELKEQEYQQLSKILSEDQMKSWINKENLMAALNPDGSESAVDDGPGLTPNGASFKF